MAHLSHFKCRVCEKWKDPAMFSNKETKGYYTKKTKNPAINGETAKLRCRECSGQQITELQCQGHCGLYKALDYFSKTQRTRGSQWCIECVLWKEAAEPGVVTAAAPYGMTSPDEHLPGTMAGSLHDSAASMLGTEDDTPSINGYHGDNGETASFQVPLHAGGTMSINNGYGRQPTASSIAGGSSTVPSMIPPHLRHLEAQIRMASAGSSILNVRPSSSSIISSTSTVINMASPSIPPHLRGISPPPASVVDSDTRSNASSVSNPFASIGGESVEGPIRGATRPAGIPHVGFDKNGVRHNQIRMPSGETFAAESSRQANSYTEPSRGGSWARAAGQKRTVPQFPQAKRAIPQPTQGVTRIVRNQDPHEKIYYSDGESADEM